MLYNNIIDTHNKPVKDKKIIYVINDVNLTLLVPRKKIVNHPFPRAVETRFTESSLSESSTIRTLGINYILTICYSNSNIKKMDFSHFVIVFSDVRY